MNQKVCRCGKELHHGAMCRRCMDALSRLKSGQRSKGRRSVPVAKEYFDGPYGKYLSQVFARNEP